MPEGYQALVEQYYACMHAGSARVDELVALFDDDAVYDESLTAGAPTVHEGKRAIEATLRAGLAQRPEDFAVKLDRVDVDEGEVVCRWTCTSSVFPGPMSGVDRFEVKDGKIARLVTRLDV